MNIEEVPTTPLRLHRERFNEEAEQGARKKDRAGQRGFGAVTASASGL